MIRNRPTRGHHNSRESSFLEIRFLPLYFLTYVLHMIYYINCWTNVYDIYIVGYLLKIGLKKKNPKNAKYIFTISCNIYKLVVTETLKTEQ